MYSIYKYFFSFVCFVLACFSHLSATPDPISFQKGNSLFVVNATTPLLTDNNKQNNFFSFLQAQNIHHIFFAARVYDTVNPLNVVTNYLDPSMSAPLSTFITRAHQAGVSVIYFDGNAQWLQSQNEYLAIQAINQFGQYNSTAAQGAQFDGIHFDMIPSNLGTAIWHSNSSHGKDHYNDQIENSFLWIVSSAKEILTNEFFLANLSISVSLNGDYSYYVTDLTNALYGANSPVDFVVIQDTMQTVDQVLNGLNGIGGVANNLKSSSLVPLLFAYDLGPAQTLTFVQSTLNAISSQFSTTKNYLGLALYDYLTYQQIAGQQVTPPPPPPAQTNRSLWVWDKNTAVVLDPATQAAFFAFLQAPHGNPKAKISRIFYSGNLYDANTNAISANHMNQIQSFISTATLQGVSVEFLTGDPTWCTDQYWTVPVQICQAVLNYNLSVQPNQRFSGIHLDIEPAALGALWTQNNTKGQDAYNDDLETNMINLYKGCRQEITKSGLNFTLAGDFQTKAAEFATDMMIPLLAPNSPLTYATIMNYYNTYARFTAGSGGQGGIDNNLPYSQIPMVFGVETNDPTGTDPQSISFYSLGNAQLETVLEEVELNYGKTTHFGGLAIEDWVGYSNLKP